MRQLTGGSGMWEAPQCAESGEPIKSVPIDQRAMARRPYCLVSRSALFVPLW
jgi:hypothetical protein